MMIDFPISLAAKLLGLCTVVVIWKLTGMLIYYVAVKYTTSLRDLEQLGRPRPGQKLPGTAIVAGESIAGILAARVLSDHFEKVVIIEPDVTPDQHRTRVGQWKQFHMFSPIVRLVLCRMFPDFDSEATRSGLRIAISRACIQSEGKTNLLDPDGIPPCIVSTRHVFETFLRQLLRKRSQNIAYVNGQVVGITPSDDGSRIVSVRVHITTADGSISTEQLLPTSFLADCTGGGCGGMRWVKQAFPALGRVGKDVYDHKLHYSTAIVRPSPTLLAKINKRLPEEVKDAPFVRALFPSHASGSSIGYILGRGDNESFVLLASRYGGALEQLPNSREQYAQQVKDAELATSKEATHEPSYIILRALEEAQDGELPDGIVWEKYRVPPSYHNRYDCMQALPANFAVLGDAFIRLHPSFGQGCSKASCDALTLDAFLRAVPYNDQATVPKRFAVNLMKKLSRQNRGLFDSNRLNDYAHSTTVPMEGETLASGEFTRAYVRSVLNLVHKDVDAGTLFYKVTNMLEPSILLFKPSLVTSVLWNKFMAA